VGRISADVVSSFQKHRFAGARLLRQENQIKLRQFINTWSVRNDTREELDLLPKLVRSPLLWRKVFPRHALSEIDDLERLQRLRSDLRRTSQKTRSSDEALNDWFSRAALGVRAQRVGDDTKLGIESAEKGFVG